MEDKLISLEPEGAYHIYNRANGNERLFLNVENYRFFLEKYRQYISPIADTFCYCLMPNHFHFLVRIKGEQELVEAEAFPKSEAFPKFQTLEKLLSKQFSNFFSCYTQAFNKLTDRKGSLFMKNFKRKKVADEAYLRKLVHYIHYNPIEADLVELVGKWKYSSYAALLLDKHTWLQKDEVMSLFYDLENFVYCHHYPPKISGIEEL